MPGEVQRSKTARRATTQPNHVPLYSGAGGPIVGCTRLIDLYNPNTLSEDHERAPYADRIEPSDVRLRKHNGMETAHDVNEYVAVDGK